MGEGACQCLILGEKLRDNLGVILFQIVEGNAKPEMSIVKLSLMNDLTFGTDDLIPDPKGDLDLFIGRGEGAGQFEEDPTF